MSKQIRKSSGGRPFSVNYEELDFILNKSEDGKLSALCKICNRILRNTAAQRLKAHRKNCRNKRIKEGVSAKENNNESLNSSLDETIIGHEPELILIADNENENSYFEYNLNETHPNESIILLPSSQHQEAFNIAMPKSVRSSTSTPIITESRPSSSVTMTSESTKPSSSNSTSYSFDSIPTKFESTGSYSSSTTSLASTSSISKLSKRIRKSSRITSFVDKTNDKEIFEVTEAMARFFFACNIPFNVVESKFFLDFIKAIRPSFVSKLPKRQALANKWLDIVYEDYKKKSTAVLKKDSVLLIDGWKNTSANTKTVVCILHDCTITKRVFIDAWNLNGISETADKLGEIVCEAINLSKNNYNVDVFAVVSDNASNMVRMGKNLKHAVWHVTCNARTGNLFAKEIVNPKLNDQVCTVLRFFKQADFEQAIVNKGGTKIKFPCETRWSTYRDSYKCLISNLTLMKVIAAESGKVRSDVMKLLFDDNFIETVQENIEVFDPICKLINECQNSKTSQSDAVNMWLNLKVPQKFYGYYSSRLEMALNQYAITAYYLHPFYNNDALHKNHLTVANNFLFQNLNADGLDEWDKFKSKEGIFELLHQKEIKCPILFWKTAEFYAPSLSKLAVKLLKIPASSAEIERIFSKWNLIHTPIRNRLTFEKSKKLMHLYMALRMEVGEIEIEDDDFDDVDE